MKPELNSVSAISIGENSTEVELIYIGSELLAGIDLHGIGSGLSWLRDKGLHFDIQESEERIINYSIIISLESNCEFRARSYIIDEDYWETNNHKLSRLDNGSIEIETDEETFSRITFSPSPPNPFLPKLKGIILNGVSKQSSTIKIKYQTKEPVSGIELHGVNEGLSWVKNQSTQLDRDEESPDKLTNQIEESENEKDKSEGTLFSIELEIIDSVEFRARSFNDLGDHWESGENHKINRRTDGTIKISEELDSDIVFIYHLPLDNKPSLDSALKRLSEENEDYPSLFQYLIDTSVWFKEYYQDPLDQDLFDLISRMIRFIREKQREIASYKFDNLVNPIVKALHNLYQSAISFLEEDIEILKNTWKEKFYPELFDTIPKEIGILLSNNFQTSDDKERRIQELWKFN